MSDHLDTFFISSEECLILRACAVAPSLREAARMLGKDPAGLQRRVADLARRHDLLEKRNNRWMPTQKGQRLLVWTDQSIRSQSIALSQNSTIRLATLPWIGDYLIRSWNRWTLDKVGASAQMILFTDRSDFEADLLEGRIDFAVGCHPPKSPALRHKRLISEDWVICVPATWKPALKGMSVENIAAVLSKRPLIQHLHIDPRELFAELDPGQIGLQVDTLAAVRASVEAAVGWGVLPRMSVADGDHRKLYVLPIISKRGFVSLWWRREAAEEVPVQKVLRQMLQIFK